MAQAYDAIIATITTTSDAVSVTKEMVNNTQWREGTSGVWSGASCKLDAGKIYQFRTPLSGMSSNFIAVLPDIKAYVEVDWDTDANPILSVGDYFLFSYAYYCTKIIYLGVPDTSELNSVGNYFMAQYAIACSSLKSLDVPDISNCVVAGDNFMTGYANGCSVLKSLPAPSISFLKSVGNDFMSSYAYNCSGLAYLGIPYTSSMSTVGTRFMQNYAQNCNNLNFLDLPLELGWFENNNINWNVPSGRLGTLRGLTYSLTSQTAWQTLIVSGKTLYTNYIRTTSNVAAVIKDIFGPFFDNLPFDKSKFNRETNEYLESYIFSESSMATFPEVETPIRPTRISTGSNNIQCILSYTIELTAVHPVDDFAFGGIKDTKLILYLPLTIDLYSEGAIDNLIIGDMELSDIDLRSIELKPNETITIDTDSMTVLFGLTHDVSSITDASVFFELDKGLNDLIITWEYEGGIPNPLPEKQLDVTIIWQNRYL